MKFLITLIVAIISLAINPALSQAGFMDKLNAATQTINNAAKQIKSQAPKAQSTSSSTEDPDRPLHLEDHYKGSCEGKRSATCMDYMEIAGQCMDPLKGYRSKLTANLIEKKLKEDKTLNAKQRKNFEEDLVELREAEKNNTDPKSQRYLQNISEEDQVCINADYGTFYKKIYNKCMGADHMGIGKRTEMMQDQETVTCEQAVAQYRENNKKENAPMTCMMGVAGLRYTIMAEMMEKKMQALTLSDKERAEWESDIALMHTTAKSGGTKIPQSDDPKNPTRYMMRLTSNEDMMQLNNEYSQRSQTMIAECSNPTKSTSKPEKSKGTGLVNHSQSPANKNAKKHVEKQYADLNYGRGGSTNLLAMRRDKGCADVLKGNVPKLTADKLEAKLKSSSGISAQKRQEWEEDIAAFRAAADAGVDSPEPPDPDNPYRWYDYVTNQERAAINKEHADLTVKVMKECNSKPSGL